MPMMALVWHKGQKGRPPKEFEDAVIAALKTLDPEGKQTLPIALQLNGVDYLIVWRDHPIPPLPTFVV